MIMLGFEQDLFSNNYPQHGAGHMKKGFTLIETIMMIVILGILAAVVALKYMSVNKDAELATAKQFGGALKTAASFYLSRMLLNGSANPKPDRFNSFVGFNEGSSDMNFIYVTNSIRGLLANPSAMVGIDDVTIKFDFKSGATAVYTLDPATGNVTDSFSGFE
jgi:MSHA pilin protein MshA